MATKIYIDDLVRQITALASDSRITNRAEQVHQVFNPVGQDSFNRLFLLIHSVADDESLPQGERDYAKGALEKIKHLSL